MNPLGFPFIQIECQRAGVQSMRVQTKMKWVDINGDGIQVCEETCENMYIFFVFFLFFCVYVQSMDMVNVFVYVHYIQASRGEKKVLGWGRGVIYR